MLGNLIAIGVIVVFMLIVFIFVFILVHNSAKDEYEYCHDCPYGLCIEEPKSKNCWKYSDELNASKPRGTPWFHSIDMQAEVDKIAEKKH